MAGLNFCSKQAKTGHDEVNVKTWTGANPKTLPVVFFIIIIHFFGGGWRAQWPSLN